MTRPAAMIVLYFEPLTNRWLWTIIAFQFLPLLTIVGIVDTYFNRKMGHVYVGGFMSAMIIAWIVVASTAIHYAF